MRHIGRVVRYKLDRAASHTALIFMSKPRNTG